MQSFKEFFNNDIVQEEMGMVNWITPMINTDMVEIQKSAARLKVDLKSLQSALKTAKLTDFSKIQGGDQFWKTLKNTNVAQTSSQISKDANKPKTGINSPAPIVLVKDNQINIIGGLARMMAAKAVNAKPKVLVVNM
jgi:hypothetical protein